MDVDDPGRWLVEHRVHLDRGEAEWLERLARFDREELWARDGHLSCATWLVWRTNMARSTAFEKLRIAHELERRPVIARAYRQGRLSYSAVRAITRMDRPDPEVDEAMVELAGSGRASIVDVERAVRAYMLYADQGRPPRDDAPTVRDVRIRRGDDGTGQILVTLRDIEIEEFAVCLQAFLDLKYRAGDGEVPAGRGGPEDVPVGPVVDESSAGDSSDGTANEVAPAELVGWAERRADAFMELVATAIRAADDGHACGADRYLVHVVTRDQGRSLSFLDGRPVHPVDSGLIACDSSHVTHTVTDTGAPLNLGRKTREWNTAQRRAISVRDGGQCRFPGCPYIHYDIHHLRPWEDGGPTDIANGICACRRHHRLVHAGYHVEGDPNGELRFHRPDGSYIGSSRPAEARVLVWRR